MDFEKAAANAFSHFWPNTFVKGFLFHLTQNIFRKFHQKDLEYHMTKILVTDETHTCPCFCAILWCSTFVWAVVQNLPMPIRVDHGSMGRGVWVTVPWPIPHSEFRCIYYPALDLCVTRWVDESMNHTMGHESPKVTHDPLWCPEGFVLYFERTYVGRVILAAVFQSFPSRCGIAILKWWLDFPEQQIQSRPGFARLTPLLADIIQLFGNLYKRLN